MPVTETLLHLLRCPKNHGPLRPASSEETVNLKAKYHLHHQDIVPTGFLISVNGDWAYVEREGVPCLLIDEAIPFTQMK